MGTIGPIPRNTIVGGVADLLRYGKNKLNAPGKLPTSWPLVGGMGAGDLALGNAPEAMDDYSQGMPPVQIHGMTSRVDPRMLDIAALAIPAVKALRMTPKVVTPKKIVSDNLIDDIIAERLGH